MPTVENGLSIGNRVIAAARSLVERGAVVGSVGNVSARVGAGFIVTPSRCPYERIEVADLAHVLDGEATGPLPPSREWRLHSAVYDARPDAGAVVHTHSPQATAWSFLGEDLAPELEDNEYYETGPIHTAPPAPSGSVELAAGAARTLGRSRAVLLGRHGVLAIGASPEQAVLIAAVVERQAQVAWLLRGA